jgi:hypothetical protein
MTKSKILPIELVRKLVSYDTETGILTWLPREAGLFKDGKKIKKEGRAALWNAAWAGREAGGISNQGYRVLEINGKAFLCHRISWAIFYGEFPRNQIDHINGNRSDNRISNLREVTAEGNAKNRKVRVDSRSGVSGVSQLPGGRWRASIAINGKRTHLGVYSTVEAASKVREKFKDENGYHKNHGAR